MWVSPLAFCTYLFTVSAFCVHGKNEGVTYVSNSSIFWDLVDTSVPAKVIANESVWAEGPVVLKDGTLVFSEVMRNRAVNWTEKDGINVISSPSNFENGNSVDREGRLVASGQGERSILRRELNGTWVTLVDSFEGKRLNGPDDVVVSSNGDIWFADSAFGLTDLRQGYGGKQELEGKWFFRFNPTTKELVRLNTPEIVQPNGLALSPDESILYVTDTPQNTDGGHVPQIYAYEISDGNLKNGKLFRAVTPGIPDGIKVDEFGNLWSSSAEGIHIYSPKGELLGKILIESSSATSNLAFGKDSEGRKWVYITATMRVLRLAVKVDGSTAKWLDAPSNTTGNQSFVNDSTNSSVSEQNTPIPRTPNQGTSSQGVPVANAAMSSAQLPSILMFLIMLFA